MATPNFINIEDGHVGWLGWFGMEWPISRTNAVVDCRTNAVVELMQYR